MRFAYRMVGWGVEGRANPVEMGVLEIFTSLKFFLCLTHESFSSLLPV